MAKAEVKHPEKQVSTGACSAGILVAGWLSVGGPAEDLRTGALLPGTTAEQTRVALRNTGKVLAAAGAGFADVVKCTCFLAGLRDFDEFAHAEFFPPPLPARTTVAAGLAEGVRVEIDAVARIRRGNAE